MRAWKERVAVPRPARGRPRRSRRASTRRKLDEIFDYGVYTQHVDDSFRRLGLVVKPIDLRGQHDLGEIIGLAWRLYARNFGPMLLMALTTVPLQMLGAVLQDAGTPPVAQAAISAGFVVASIVVGAVANGALIHAVNEAAAGVAPEFSRSIDAGIAHVSALISTVLLALSLTILSVLAAPYFAVRWTFSSQAVMLEDKRNWAALDASSSIVKGRWWRTFGILLVSSLVMLGPLVVANAAALSLPALAGSTIESAVVALALPFLVGSQTLLYFDLRARKAASEVTLPELASEPDADTDLPVDPPLNP